MCACVHRYKNLTLCVCLYMCVICMYVLIYFFIKEAGKIIKHCYLLMPTN